MPFIMMRLSVRYKKKLHKHKIRANTLDIAYQIGT